MKKLFSPPENATPQVKAAIQHTWVVLGALPLTFFVYLFLAFQMHVWQLFVAAGVSLLITIIALVTLQLIQKGRPIVGMRLLTGAMLGICLLAPFIFADNVGSMVGVIIFIVSLLFAIRTLPPTDLPRIIFIGLIAMGTVVLIDIAAPASQISIPAAGTITLIGGGFTVLMGIFLIAREFETLPIASKLLLTFLTITLIPFFTLGFLLIQVTGKNLTDAAGNSLKTLSHSQAVQIGGKLADEEESLRLLAINPVVSEQLTSIDQSASGDLATIQADLKKQEATWTNLPDNAPQVQQILNHPITLELNHYLNTISNNLDLLVTDKYGAVIAATRRPLHYNMADQVWWRSALDDGEEDVYVSQPAVEHPGDELSISFSVPIIEEDTKALLGVLHATYSMQTFAEILKQETAGTRGGADLLLPEGRVYRVEGDIVTFDAATNANLAATVDAAYGQFFYDEGPSLVSQSLVTTNDTDLAPAIEKLNWHLIHDIDSADALASLKVVTEIGISTGLAVLLLITFIALWLSRRISLPIIGLTQTAQKIADGDLNTQSTITSKDEIGVLAATFNTMTTQLRQTLEEVQQQATALQTSTQTLSRQAIQLQAATEVSRAVSSILNVDELIQKAVDLVRDRFDLYYAGLFLLDEEHSFAILKAATGEAGARMLADDYKLEVNNDSMIGGCIQHKEARVALNVRAEVGRLGNPLLPKTRSELALPLISQGQIIGAMTIQSEQESAFSPEDISILQGMGDQLANGIEKARLYKQIQQRAIELELAREVATSAKDEAEKARITAETANRTLAAQMWQTTGQAALNEKMRGEQNISTLSHNVIQQLCKYLTLYSGAIYILEDQILQLAATYAYRQNALTQRYQVGEDLIGQAAFSKEIISNEIPENYIEADLIKGKILPRFSLIVPVIYNQQVSGVVLVESMVEFTPPQKKFLENAMESVAIAFTTAQARTHVDQLFAQTRQQAEELQAQEEELRASNEELQAQAESLRNAETRSKTNRTPGETTH